MNVDVHRHGGHEDPRKPADDEHRDERNAVQHDTIEARRPPHIVPSQLNVFTADGRAIRIVETMNVIPRADSCRGKHMMTPHDEAQPGDRAIE